MNQEKSEGDFSLTRGKIGDKGGLFMLTEYRGSLEFTPGEIKLMPDVAEIASIQEVIKAIQHHVENRFDIESVGPFPQISKHTSKAQKNFFVITDTKLHSVLVVTSDYIE